jgi:hypothetical protein
MITSMPDTAAVDFLTTVPGRFMLLIAALLLITLGSMLRHYQKYAQLSSLQPCSERTHFAGVTKKK